MSARLIEAVYRLLESADVSFLFLLHKTFWLLHVYFFIALAIQKRSFYVQCLDFPIFECGMCE